MNEVVRALDEADCRLKEINELISKGDSEIQKFYQESVVFVTGASGFMGKLLVEKLLRACNVKKLYILIRSKKGKTIQERINVMKSDPVFDYLRQTQPNFEDKIEAVAGDVAEIRLGISDHDWETLTKEVDTIFHLAATTRFDMPLQTATLINTRGTRETLQLAKQCPKLRVFVHVSTAYCHATTDKIGVQLDDEFHQCPIPPNTLIELVEKVDNNRLQAITSGLTNYWSNTYTFTKAVSEELVRSMADELPICIIRPPIVIGTYTEPTRGWLDMSCVYGPTGIVLGSCVGLLHVLNASGERLLCFMPGDYVNNSILAAAWDCVEWRKAGDKDIKVYTPSSSKYEITLGTVVNNLRRPDIRAYASTQSIWYNETYLFENNILYCISNWLLHYIPAIIVDFIINVFRISKPDGITSFMDVYKKIDRMVSAFDYFLLNNWRFDDKNIMELNQKMSPVDQKIFNIDASTIKWKHMSFIWGLGLKKYIMKDPTLLDKNAIRKQNIFKVAHYTVLFIYLYVFYIFFYYLYICFK